MLSATPCIDWTDTSTIERIRIELSADHPDPALIGLLVGSIFDPSVSIQQYLDQIDVWSAKARTLLGRRRRPRSVASVLRTVLAEEAGFDGDRQTYYDLDNSLLHRVIDRRKGIPITLSLIYMGVAQRIGQPANGVGMPLHFLIGWPGTPSMVYQSPYHAGNTMDMTDCARLLGKLSDHSIELTADMIAPVDMEQILHRILGNIKHVCMQKGDLIRASQVIDLMRATCGVVAQDTRDQGVLSLGMKRWRDAVQWMEVYLELSPQAEDKPFINKCIGMAQERLARRN
jgi:regulator of sirC expression with transglutaminase-like and TPR domain